jgi:hypothetical protein
MKTLREYIDMLDEISRRDFLKGAAATAGLAAMGARQAQGMPAIPDAVKQRQLVIAYFKIIRDMVNPLIKFDKTYLTDNPSSMIYLWYDRDGNILDVKSMDNTLWSRAVLDAFAKAFPSKQLPKGFEQFRTPAERTSWRLGFMFTPKQVYGLEDPVRQIEESELEDPISKIDRLFR